MMNGQGIGKVSRGMTAILFGVAMAGSANPAWADPIGVGTDEFHTLPGTFAILPAELGGGRLDLISRPLGFTGGDTDTIVQRLAGIDPLPVGGQGTIPIQIVALSLESVNPVPIGLSSFFDVFVSLAGPQAVGTMTIRHVNADGGTF